MTMGTKKKSLVLMTLCFMLNCQTPSAEDKWQEFSHELSEEDPQSFFNGMLSRIDCAKEPLNLICNKKECVEDCDGESECEKNCGVCDQRQDFLDRIYALKCQEATADCQKSFELLYCCSAMTYDCIFCIAEAEKKRQAYRNTCKSKP